MRPRSSSIENGIPDYVTEELGGEEPLTPVQFWSGGAPGPGPGGQAGLQGASCQVALCFSNRLKPDRILPQLQLPGARRLPGAGGAAPPSFTRSTAYLKQNGKYLKNESKITYQDVQDCLVLVSSSFSTQTSYENQTKKAITNKFIYEAMTEFLRHQLEVYFIENPDDADRHRRAGAGQQAQPGKCGKDPPEPQEEARGQH